ncbi:hypothetical protein KPL74_20360 [Bacillus sp. NP157]|nr:hypothetical protein KPL74_20360 [Bacillus sp. NP157]
MQQFIPFDDQWDARADLVPFQAGGACPVTAAAPRPASALCGSRFQEEDLFAGWPEDGAAH